MTTWIDETTDFREIRDHEGVYNPHYPPLFKVDTTGKIRTWQPEVRGRAWRTHTGIRGGSIVTSGWKYCTARSRDTDQEQAKFEVESEIRKKIDIGGFAERVEDSGKTYVSPMLAQKYNPQKFKWEGRVFAQPKLDGIRCVATIEGMFTRNGKVIRGAPHVNACLVEFFERNPDAILDGELYNHELRDDFNKITSIVRKDRPSEDDVATSAAMIEYHVYDVPSMLESSFMDRSMFIVDNLFHVDPRIVPVETIEVHGEDSIDQLFSRWIAEGYEGQMIRLNGPYQNKRSKNLLKRKDFQDDEFRILRVEEGAGNWAGKAKRIVCELPDGREFGSGFKGSAAEAEVVLADASSWVGELATIQYFELTPDGVPRFPVCVKMHRGGRD